MNSTTDYKTYPIKLPRSCFLSHHFQSSVFIWKF